MSLSQPPIGTVVTTDPVTGLPLTSTDPGIIDQIPFNSDPRALQDWAATARASTSIYPDDYPWVMATNHAQNSLNPQVAQSMQTDGQHRLLVNTGSTGGGGATPVVMNDVIVTVEAFTNGPSYNLAGVVLPGSTLYGYSLSVGWMEPLGTVYNSGGFILDLYNSTTHEQVTLAAGQIQDLSAASGTGHAPFNQTVMYPVPRDLTPLLATDPNNIHLFIETTKNLINIQVVLFTS